MHGQDGLDEISLAAPTDVWDLQAGAVSAYTVTPDDFGLGSVDIDSLRVDSPAESAATVRAVLAGEHGPARDVVLANCAGALVAADRAGTLRDGVALAAQSIDSGAAKARLNALVELSQSLG